jgi:hypothetical protein
VEDGLLAERAVQMDVRPRDFETQSFMGRHREWRRSPGLNRTRTPGAGLDESRLSRSLANEPVQMDPNVRCRVARLLHEPHPQVSVLHFRPPCPPARTTARCAHLRTARQALRESLPLADYGCARVVLFLRSVDHLDLCFTLHLTWRTTTIVIVAGFIRIPAFRRTHQTFPGEDSLLMSQGRYRSIAVSPDAKISVSSWTKCSLSVRTIVPSSASSVETVTAFVELQAATCRPSPEPKIPFNIPLTAQIATWPACKGAVSGKDFRPAPLGDAGFGQLSYDKGMRVLCAAQPAQTERGVWLDGGGRTLLAEALERVTGREPDASIGEWLKAAQAELPKLIRQIFPGMKESEVQTPVLFDFVREPVKGGRCCG